MPSDALEYLYLFTLVVGLHLLDGLLLFLVLFKLLFSLLSQHVFELGVVASVIEQLLHVQVNDVRAHIVQKALVVRHY